MNTSFTVLDYLIQNINRNVEEFGRDSDQVNLYIYNFSQLSFLPDLVQQSKSNVSIRKLMNHKNLKKEITESYGVYRLIDHALSRLPNHNSSFFQLRNCHSEIECNDLIPLSQNLSVKLVFFDICCGKGITSFLLAQLFPNCIIHMIDFNSRIKFDHMNELKNVHYHHLDIHSNLCEQFLKLKCDEYRLDGFTIIAFGNHLCGNLSTRIIDLFQKIEYIDVLIFSPCCLPTKKSNDNFQDTYSFNLLGDSYSLFDHWCFTLYMGLSVNAFSPHLCRDDNVLSEKKKYIWVCRKELRCIPCS